VSSWITPFGFKEVSRDFTAFGNALTRHLEDAITLWMTTQVIPTAKRNAPFKTGTLKGAISIISITQGVDKISFIVGWGTRAEYGKFVERGTKFMEARQFMLKAIMEQAKGLSGFWVKKISVSEVNKYQNKGISTFTFTPT